MPAMPRFGLYDREKSKQSLLDTDKSFLQSKMKGTEVQNPRRFAYVHVEYMYVCK